MRERAGVRHWWLHATAGRAKTFRRVAGRLLREETAALRRQSGNRLQHEAPRVAAQAIEGGKARGLPVHGFAIEAGRAWVQGITPGMKRQIEWGDPGFVCQVKFWEWTCDGKL